MSKVCIFIETNSVFIPKVCKKIWQYVGFGHKWNWENICSPAISTVLLIISSKPTFRNPYFHHLSLLSASLHTFSQAFSLSEQQHISVHGSSALRQEHFWEWHFVLRPLYTLLSTDSAAGNWVVMMGVHLCNANQNNLNMTMTMTMTNSLFSDMSVHLTCVNLYETFL